MIEKKFGIDFFSSGGALTIHSSDVQVFHGSSLTGFSERTHSDGWTIRGDVREDCYFWVNYFEAEHPVFGNVFGDFEDVVYADSEEGFENFYNNHTPSAWDYGDI